MLGVGATLPKKNFLLPPPPACRELEGSRTSRFSGSTSERVRTINRFAKALGSVAGRRLTYDELTGKRA